MSGMTMEKIWPPYGLRVQACDLLFTVLRESDVPEIIDSVRQGLHDPAEMPFLVPWTDAPAHKVPANYMRYLGRVLARQSAGTLDLQLVVRLRGELIGIQALSGDAFPVTRTAETGSWLGQRFQGQGLGTSMRQAACALAFDHLGAKQITSHAFLDNPSSRAVSRKVGYQPNGREWSERRGVVAEQESLLLTPENFVRGEAIEVAGVEELRAFVGVPAED